EELSPCHLLTVRVIRMKNVQQADVVSLTDCFVSLWLPTSSHKRLRTRTISNCRNPEWNESFKFQIQTQVKSLITNGVLVSRQMSCLEVHAESRRQKNRKMKDLLVTVTESFEHTQHISRCLEPCGPNPACFHYPKYFQPQIHVEVPKSQWSSVLCRCNACKNDPVCQSLDCLPDGQAVTLPVNKNCELHMKSTPCSEALDVRLGFSLCQAELEFLQKRRVVVAEALKQVLQLEEDLQADEVPLISIMATGGGTRSMTAMYGHLLGLQKLNILNCASYITGLSGATWTMATLYRDPDWSSKNLELAILEARRHVVKDKMPALFPDQLLKFREELQQRRQEGYRVTFTDFWGLLVEACLGDERYECKLSDQSAALCQGQNPLPIYLTINVKDDVSNQDFREWFEFSPYEVGLQKYGAFIPTELFGSEFFMGRLMRRIPESRMCYMLGGIESKAESISIWVGLEALGQSGSPLVLLPRSVEQHLLPEPARCLEFVPHLGGVFPQVDKGEKDEPLLPEIPKCDANMLDTTVVTPGSWLSNTFRNILTSRAFVSEFHNFLLGLQMHTDYYQNGQFSTWKDSVLDGFPNKLTASVNHLCLLDTAFVINSSYPPILRPERKADLIIHLNYCAGSQTKASS
ncbi:hypothetical protein EI555_016568, partial [Monodon monoceros]